MNKDVLREATPDEQMKITSYEETRYAKEIKSIKILLVVEGIAVLAPILDLFLPLNLGVVRSIILTVLGLILGYMTIKSLNIIRRQFNKIKNQSYKVLLGTVIETQNQVHGLTSDFIATVANEDGDTYVLNTNTTGDVGLLKGNKGLLVIIDGEENVLFTSKYRFIEEELAHEEGN